MILPYETPNPFAPQGNPVTDEQWKVAGQAAEIVMALELARRWGLIDGRGRPNLERCEQFRGTAQQKGVGPDKART